MNEPNLPGTPPRSSSFGCLKILAIAAGVLALLLITFGVLVWQSISWAKNAPENKIASYPPLNLSDGEKEDVDRILGKLGTAQKDKAIVDEYVSPEVFNGVMDKIIQGEKLKPKKKAKKEQPLFFRGGFSGQDLELKITVPAPDAGNGSPNSTSTGTNTSVTPEYVNADVVFDLEVVDGKFTVLDLKRVLVHDQPPPLFARWYLESLVKLLRQNPSVTVTSPPTPPSAAPAPTETSTSTAATAETTETLTTTAMTTTTSTVTATATSTSTSTTLSGTPPVDPLEGLRMFKLIKREGEKIHFVIDGSKIKPEE